MPNVRAQTSKGALTRVRHLALTEIKKLRNLSSETDEPLQTPHSNALVNYVDIIIKISKEERMADEFKRLHTLKPDELAELARQVMEKSPWVKK